MKILLTGANGFVGSHLLDSLLARNLNTAVLLRPSSHRQFIQAQLHRVQVCEGSISDPESLRRACAGVTHMIHCAGSTRSLGTAGFFEVNQLGTRYVVEAVNDCTARLQRLVHISSLAAAGPGTPECPARETDPPRPVSAYGRSKLAGEEEVRTRCRTEFVILRPPGVYGPRDAEFLRLFKAVKAHILPTFGGGRQPLSLVYAKDLAEATVEALLHPAAAGRTFHVASEELTTARGLAETIAGQMNVRTLPVPLPLAVLWAVCLGQEILSRLTRNAHVLSLQKYAELRAPGWVCDPTRLRQELGIDCRTKLAAGVAVTLDWYRAQHWI